MKRRASWLVCLLFSEMSLLIKPSDAVPISHCYGSDGFPLISILISWWTSFQGVWLITDPWTHFRGPARCKLLGGRACISLTRNVWDHPAQQPSMWEIQDPGWWIMETPSHGQKHAKENLPKPLMKCLPPSQSLAPVEWCVLNFPLSRFHVSPSATPHPPSWVTHTHLWLSTTRVYVNYRADLR